MRCPICDFNDDLPLSQYGLSRGYTKDGLPNVYMPVLGCCLVCADEVIDAHAMDETTVEVDKVYEDDFGTAT